MLRKKFNFVFCLSLFVFCVVNIIIFHIMYEYQSSPYIDEIFHIPQAQRYCVNNWTEWDNKITTLPGLYIISYLLTKPLEIVIDKDLCTVYGLRVTNILGTFLNVILAYKIKQKLSKTRHDVNLYKQRYIVLLSAFNIAMFPPLYFFTFLYYTDVWSVTAVLFMYYNHLVPSSLSKLLSGLGGLVSIFMRQTNIIWVGLLLIDSAWKAIPLTNKRPQNIQQTFKILASYLPNSKIKKPKGETRLKLVERILKSSCPYVVLCILFFVFLIVNGSIVVGDKIAHTAILHPAQILYFLFITAFFSIPFFIYQSFELIHQKITVKYVSYLLGLFCVFFVINEFNRLEHPYLLADNRHYAFYIWKRILGHDILRRIAVIGYVVSFELLRNLLYNSSNHIFTIALAVCIVLNLTPQYLFEVRYYIIPCIMCRLQFPRLQRSLIMAETLLFLVVNGFTIYLFLFKTFKWDNEVQVQRLIW